MCGIAGFIDYTKEDKHSEILKNMTKCLAHRGPDDEGFSVVSTDTATVALGHKRLSIIDLSPSGHQPMHYRHWCIVFNGEIYNYKEVRLQLENAGYTFDSNSDTSVILKAFDYWGIKAVDTFIGMFAFFILDKNTNKAYLFRDRVGIKPVYYYPSHSLFLFSSELKAITKHPRFKKELDIHALTLFFQYGYIPGPFAVYKNTFKLQPGHFLEIDLRTANIEDHIYWNISNYYAQPRLKLPESDAITEVEKRLKKACDYRMVADVPVGLFLSGGYDSATVAALLQYGRTEKIKTFTIGFEDQKYDESQYAGEIATYLGTDHLEYHCSEKEAKEIIPVLPHFFDEPFGDSSAIPTMLVSRIARQHVTVAISADGGDEVFGGYTRYNKSLRNFQRLISIPEVVRQVMAKLMNRMPAEQIPFFKSKYRFGHYFYTLQHLFSEGVTIDRLYDFSVQYTNRKELGQLFKAGLGQKNIQDYRASQFDPLTFMMVKDTTSYLPDDILVKVDRATMASSLEGREPLLDHNLMEFVAQLPSDVKIKNGEKKYILKQIAHRHLPKHLLDRPKQGFAIPLADWLRKDLKPLVDHYLDEKVLLKQNLFNVDFIREKKQAFLAGRNDHLEFLWFLLIFQMWYDVWMTGN